MRKRKSKAPVVRTDTSQKSKKKAAIKKKVDRRAKEGTAYGIHYDSLTELYCLHWLHQLKAEGFVTSIGRAPSFLLSEGLTSTYAVQLKRGSKAVTQTILRPHTYTADFVCTFTKKALGIFCWDIQSTAKWDKRLLVSHLQENREYLCYIEVKPDFSFAGKNEKSQNDMKWVFHRYGLFINMFKPDDRFSSTFTPKEYLLTGTGASRKMKYIPRTLNEYLKLQ